MRFSWRLTQLQSEHQQFSPFFCPKNPKKTMKKFYMTAVALMLAVGASAQFSTVATDFIDFSYLPKEIADGSDLQIITGSGYRGSVDIYDSDFNQKKSVTMKGGPNVTIGYIVTKSRLPIVTAVNTTEFTVEIRPEEGPDASLTGAELTAFWWELAKAGVAHLFHTGDPYYYSSDFYINHFPSDYADYIKVDESTHTIYANDESGAISRYDIQDYYYNYSENGTKYPSVYFKFSTTDNTLTLVKVQYSTTYTGEWVETSNKGEDTPAYVENAFYDFDKGSNRVSIPVSQTLFNTDDKYEYLVPICEYVSREPEERDRDNDGEIDEISTTYNNYITGFRVMSEDGTELCSQMLENPYGDYYVYLHTYKIANKYYLVYEYSSRFYDKKSYNEIYRIDPTTSSVKRMENVQLAIRPNVVNRSSMVTVELDDTDTARELVVTGMDGRIVERRDIPAGERQIQVPAARMASGMYNFTIRKRGTVEKNGKVIVK
jgi:hypothetical protein